LPSIGFMRPFGCSVTILNTLNPLGKFQGKVDEEFLVGYSVCSSGPAWLFDIDSLSQTINYHPVLAENQSNPTADAHTGGNEHNDDIQKSVSPDIYSLSCGDQAREQGDKVVNKDKAREQGDKAMNKDKVSAAGLDFTNSTNDFATAGPLVSAAELNFTNNTNDFSAAEEPKRIHQALKDPSWIKAMKEELLQFKMQKVWILVDLPYEKRAI
nr:retrovirus-related Pol polyprotein from transposon TNT 1-94 [Tanacetum cinerariifolium]